MVAWQPIRRDGHPEVRGLRDGARLDVAIPLSGSPPAEWARFLVARYEENARQFHDEFPMPHVEGSRIFIAPQDKDLAGWVEGIDQRIQEANSYYEAQVLPANQAAEGAQQAAEERNRQRLEEARRKAQEL